jgi:hypothetical protein
LIRSLTKGLAKTLPNWLLTAGQSGSANIWRRHVLKSTQARKPQRTLRFEAPDQLAGWTNIDQTPLAVFAVHRILIGLAHETDVADFGLGKVFQRRGEFARFTVIHFDGSDVLLAAPDHLRFAFPTTLVQDIGSDGHGRDQHQRGHAQNKHDGVTVLPLTAILASTPAASFGEVAHDTGPASSMFFCP